MVLFILDPAHVVYEIEHVIRSEKRKNKTWHYVKFLFYPEKFNEWIPDENFVKR